MLSHLVDATAVLHAENICHRDISLENVLMSSSDEEHCYFSLTDFGLALSMDCKPDEFSAVGKGYYLPPEFWRTVRTKSYDPFSGDVWALGVCLYIALTG